MKELTIEEKAKAYDEAIKRAKDFMNGEAHYELKIGENIMCWVFPELRESEDERMRAMAIKAVHSPEAQSCIKSWGINPDDVIAWLEKQGEQKLILDVEIPFGAKDSELEEVSYDIPKGYHAEIDGDKVIIKKGEQKSAEWSEEDEEIHRKCICVMRASACGFPEEEKFVEQVDNWLKSLKERVQPQPKKEWSEDTQQWIDVIIKDYEDLYDADKDHRATIQSKINILKSLRPQSQWKPSNEQIKVCKELYADILSAKGFDLGTVNSELNRLEEQLKKLREE